MSTPVACPSCRSPVDVPADHAGGAINCGICWTEVSVPAAATAAVPKAAKPVVAKALPIGPAPVKAAPLPAGAKPAPGMAKLDALVQKASTRAAEPEVLDAEPVAAPPPVAKALPVPVPAKPKPVAAAAAELPAPPKPKFRVRDEDDEDRGEKPAKKSGGKGLVVGLAVGGVVVLLGGVAAAYAAYQYLKPDPAGPDVAANDPNPAFNNPNPLPQFNVPPVADLPQPDPIAPPAPVPRNGGGLRPAQPPAPVQRGPVFADDPWSPVAGANGFEATLPGRVTALNSWSENLHDPERITIGRGAKFMAHDKGYNFEITYADAPEGSTPDLAKLAAGFNNPADAKQVKFQDRDAFEFRKDDGGTRSELRRAFQVGCRVFILSASQTAMFGRDRDHLLAQQKKFFDGFKVTFDPATPAPADPFGPRRNPARPGRPPGAGGRVGVGGGEPGPQAGSLTTVAKLEPFWAAVALPKAGEFWTFGTRIAGGGRTAGVVRRYTLPGFTPKNTYYLPFPVTYAVADEAAGKLAVAAVTKPDISLADRERNVGFGDVQVYDIKPVLQGKLAERDELKPAASAGFASKLAGLALHKGSAVVLSLTNQPANRAKPWLSKLSAVDLQTGQVTKKLELPDPAWRLAVSPAGVAYCAEVPLSITGVPLLGAAKTGTVLAVDLNTFQKERTVTFPGIVVDFDVAADGTLLATVSAGPELKLIAAPPGGGTVDLAPANGGRATHNYVSLTSDGKKLVSSARGEFGVDIAGVTDLTNATGVTRKVSAAAAGNPPAPLGGGFVLTPDGNYVAFQSGAVIDLAAVK